MPAALVVDHGTERTQVMTGDTVKSCARESRQGIRGILKRSLVLRSDEFGSPECQYGLKTAILRQ